jgi:multisubunit Na+/H+ antiporter MnhB subunit
MEEIILWGVLPVLVAMIALSVSFKIATRNKSALQWTLSVVVSVLVGFSFLILYQIFFADGWPTFIPHFLVGISLALAGIQKMASK